jgi:hypothetical protein
VVSQGPDLPLVARSTGRRTTLIFAVVPVAMKDRRHLNIYTPHGRVDWQQTYAAADLGYFQSIRDRRVVFLTILAPETNCPVEMATSLAALADRLFAYCRKRGIPTRGYTEAEPLMSGGYRPHIHAVIAISERDQEHMRRHFRRFYKAPYSIQFDTVYDLCERLFLYMLKGQHTYRDRHGNYTSFKLSQSHFAALSRFAQPLRIAVGKQKKVSQPSRFEIEKIVVNEIFTFYERRPVTLPVWFCRPSHESGVLPSKQSLSERPPLPPPI